MYSYNKNKRKLNYMILIIMILVVSIGYAILSTNLNIVGSSQISAPTWDIHWENVSVKSGSVTASTPTIDTNKTTVNYSVTLTIPGEYYDFTVDAVNAGTIDGMVSVISNKLNNVEISTLPNYLEYEVVYINDADIEPNHLLAAGTSEKYKVHVGYKKDINVSDIPEGAQTLNLSFSVTYVQSDSNAVKPVPDPESFETDSWPTIIEAVRSGNTSLYSVGDTKTIDLGSFGTHLLRIANKSTPAECLTTGFSQTACGFVLEFVDIIELYNMNTTGTNVGGWPVCAMRTHVNIDLYNAMPKTLRNGIIDTTVISGHGSTSGETNFVTTDKIYLLSTHEIWEDDDGNPNSGIDYRDKAYNETRQLDYYLSQGVTLSNYSAAIKLVDNIFNRANWWWLRTSRSDNTGCFYAALSGGNWGNNFANGNYGVSPAFRIG